MHIHQNQPVSVVQPPIVREVYALRLQFNITGSPYKMPENDDLKYIAAIINGTKYYDRFSDIYVSWKSIIPTAGSSNDVDTLPKIIWQTWRDHDILFFRNVHRMKHSNPNWTFVLLNETEIAEFFEFVSPNDEIVRTAYKSYKLINSINVAARSDVLRYAIMWYFGGIYVEMDAEIYDLNKLHTFGNEHDVILSREPSIWDMAGEHRHKILQWLLVSKPKQKLFANVINLIHHTLTFDQPEQGLQSSSRMPMLLLRVRMTGSFMLTRAFDDTVIDNRDEENERILVYGIEYDGLAAHKAWDIHRYQPGVFRLPITN